MYEITGSLDGVTPGRRVVRDLTVKELGLAGQEGLQSLAGFPALEDLTVEQVRAVDLRPLIGLPLRGLTLGPLSGVDLAPLADLEQLEALTLFDLRECTVPDRLELAAGLRGLTIFVDARGLTGQPVAQLIAAIDWSRLGGLENLTLAVGGNEPLTPVQADLGFLGLLPKLQRLDLHTGVWHAGPGDYPLAAPFDGLSRSLTFLRYSAWDPEPLKDALKAYLGRTTGVAVYQREAAEGVDQRPWEPIPPGDGVQEWTAYGSLATALGGGRFDVESDAVEAALARLDQRDARRARTIEFDPEADGTGISAATRDDLLWALQTLRLDPG